MLGAVLSLVLSLCMRIVGAQVDANGACDITLHLGGKAFLLRLPGTADRDVLVAALRALVADAVARQPAI